ncbi:PKD domain-containing protein [Fulvivirga sp. M361]|uniref:PKD domain-containing protein n=1 Tax=Fulvivirga sp. M361 TaxID=2594266 RepID=UPI001629D9CE|nr:T9SS type A sorting domain-containing protein [Fulvivirga sp. M361]
MKRNVSLILFGLFLTLRSLAVENTTITERYLKPLACDAEFTYQLNTLPSGVHLYTFTANDTDPSKTYEWDFGGNRQVEGREVEHIFFDGGGWLVKLTVTDGGEVCHSSQNVTVDGVGIPCFFNVTKTAEDSVIFEPFTPFGSASVAYSLDFGDGNIQSDTSDFGGLLPVIRYKYQLPGNYTACLTSANASDGTDACTYCKEITISTGSDPNTCNANFSYTIDSTSTAGVRAYTFTAEDTDPSKTYEWDFGGNRQVEGREVEHIFFDGGGWLVKLTVTDGGEVCNSSQNVTVDGVGIPCFFNVTKTAEDSVVFEPFTPFGSTSVAYSFDFGDGSAVQSDTLEFGGLLPVIRYKYQLPGDYRACLTSANASDGTDPCTYCKEITISTGSDTTVCNANFNYTVDSATTAGIHTYVFTAEDTDLSKTYQWDFEGQRQVKGRVVKHIFEDAGNWSVSLIVKDGIDSCQSIQIIRPPQPERCFFNIARDLITNTIKVEPWAVLSSASQAYTLDFGDGTVVTDTTEFGGSLPIREHTYASAGNYQVCLNVTDDQGAICSFCETVVLDPSNGGFCNAGFTFEADSIQPLRYVFTANDQDLIKTFNWTVEGGFQASGPVLDFLFPDAGLWTINLMVSNGTDTCSTSQTLFIDTPSTDSLYIQGTLRADLQPVNGGILELYRKNEDLWKKHATTTTNNGTYRFSGLSKGTYLIHARGDESNFTTFIPTYFVNGIAWQDAYTLDLTGAAEEVDITLIRSQSLSRQGQGVLQGRVTIEGDPAPQNDAYVVLLKDATSSRAIEWTMSSNDESFQFDQLPFGKYHLTLERPSMTVQQTYVLSESNPDVRDIELGNGRITSLEDELVPEAYAIYPTIVEDRVNVRSTGGTGEVIIQLRSATGKAFFTTNSTLLEGEVKELILPVGMPDGLYFLGIQDKNGNIKVHKLIKN